MKLDLLPPEIDEEIDIVPLVSCAFLVMFILLISSRFLDEATGMRVELPTGTEPTQTLFRDDADAVTLSAAGGIEYRDAAGPIALATLADLEEKLKSRPDCQRPLILRCDRQCTYEQYTFLKNATLNAGVTRLFEETTNP